MTRLQDVIIMVGAVSTLIAGGDAFAQQAEKVFSHAIAPRKIAEECVKLRAGESVGYAFEIDAPADFNIHFHRGDDVVYPVKSDQIRQAEDRFTALTAEEYCLMWTNRTPATVIVKGKLRP